MIPDGLIWPLGKPCTKDGELQISAFARELLEIPRKELTLIKKLGEGQFGEVHLGYWKRTKPVAIKTLKTDGTVSEALLKAFLCEAKIMKDLVHKNMVQFYGVCTTRQPIYIISELMENKSLLEYLKSEKGKALDLVNLIDIAAQIAEGMAYLEQTNYVHRDLAARNILLDGKNIAKIADFGLARAIPSDIYMAKRGTTFPIKWTAPEALFYSTFSIKSDIWSFGIVLTELITYGATPYPGKFECCVRYLFQSKRQSQLHQGLTNADVTQRLETNYRMVRPQNCPEMLYDIMLLCWQREPKNRPTFVNLQYRLEEFIINGDEYEVLCS
jgi:serine/threonine protein kinase